MHISYALMAKRKAKQARLFQQVIRCVNNKFNYNKMKFRIRKKHEPIHSQTEEWFQTLCQNKIALSLLKSICNAIIQIATETVQIVYRQNCIVCLSVISSSKRTALTELLHRFLQVGIISKWFIGGVIYHMATSTLKQDAQNERKNKTNNGHKICGCRN